MGVDVCRVKWHLEGRDETKSSVSAHKNPDISPADMNSVESMAAILHKVIDVIYHNSVYYEKVYSMRLMVIAPCWNLDQATRLEPQIHL